MDPLIWPDAKTWNPLRWLDEKGVGAAAREQYTEGEQIDYGFGQVSKGTESPYAPFGAGRHRCATMSLAVSAKTDETTIRCVGESFAYLQLSVVISYIVRNYTLKLENREFPLPNYKVSLSSDPDRAHSSADVWGRQ